MAFLVASATLPVALWDFVFDNVADALHGLHDLRDLRVCRHEVVDDEPDVSDRI